MSAKKFVLAAVGVAVIGAVFCLGRSTGYAAAEKEKASRVFEMRTYTATEGNLDKVLARFRDHTCKLFEKHGMTNIGYWVPADEPKSKDTLVYIISHESRDAAKKSWDEFRNDPDWKKAQSESEAGGKIVAKAESVFLNPTDFSQIK